MNTSRVILVILIFSLILMLGGLFLKHLSKKPNIPAPPKPKIEKIQGVEKVKYPVDYNLVLLGDSMTAALGNSDELRSYLKNYYPGKTFEVLNYGFGSTNILSMQDRLLKTTFYDREFRPITDIDFDLILIESFGHNPLSELPLDEGLKKQNEVLDLAVKTINSKNPRAKIVFMTPIAPSRQNYAKTKVALSSDQRKKWVEERIAYIKNHIEFAKSHDIPIIDIYSASLDQYGEANMDYIRKDDYIHPSPSGIVFISKQIADFLFNQKLL